MASLPKLFVVGVGPGAPDMLTDGAKRIITSADLVVGWTEAIQVVKGLPLKASPRVQNEANVWEVANEVAEEARTRGLTVCVLRTGDVTVSSAINKVLEPFSGFEVELVPGISSVQVAAAKARISLEDSVIVSFHKVADREESFGFMKMAYENGKHLVILCDEDYPPEALAGRLSPILGEGTKAMVCYNLTLNEGIAVGSLAELSNGTYPILSVVVVFNS
jgi:precorrin-6y C5,15-methyltransferase (decarboxylating) CbiE subunit